MLPIRVYNLKTSEWLNSKDLIISGEKIYENLEGFKNQCELKKEDIDIMYGVCLVSKDKQEFFEGDIIKTKSGKLMIVSFATGSRHGLGERSVTSGFACLHGSKTYTFDLLNDEIVGNIHDNPELINETQ